MEYSERFQILTSQGRTLNLQYPFALRSITGLNLPGTQDRTARSPMQDGDTYLGALVEPRIINLVVTLKGRSRIELGELRRMFSRRLNPKAAPLQLRAFFGDDTRYRLRNLSCQGPIEGPIMYEGDAVAQTMGVRLIAHDTIWYSDTPRTAELTALQTEQLVFPVSMGPGGTFLFGSLAVSSLVDAQNLGDWDAFPLVTLPSPMDRPRILNTTTGEVIRLNYSIAAGEIVYINTTPGEKDVYNNYGQRLQTYLEDGDFASFHLEPDSEAAPDGHNYIVLQGSTTGVLIQGSLSWYDRMTAV